MAAYTQLFERKNCAGQQEDCSVACNDHNLNRNNYPTISGILVCSAFLFAYSHTELRKLGGRSRTVESHVTPAWSDVRNHWGKQLIEDAVIDEPSHQVGWGTICTQVFNILLSFPTFHTEMSIYFRKISHVQCSTSTMKSMFGVLTPLN